jgi:hypothetical protein
MKERPILFSGDMVRAILKRRKTHTRRPVKHIPMLGYPEDWCLKVGTQEFDRIVGDYQRYCPFGQPGDRLWVRETWAEWMLRGGHEKNWGEGKHGWGNVIYRATHNGGMLPECEGFSKWRPSIHMPRWASRLTLEIVSVRVERVQDISESDALNEGILEGYKYAAPGVMMTRADGEKCDCAFTHPTAKRAYQCLWESIYGADAWDANPWVWVVAFRVIQHDKTHEEEGTPHE